MKTKLLLLVLPLLLSAQSVEPDLKWVDNEIEAIKPPRTGVAPYKIAKLKDPFAYQLMLNRPQGKGSGKKTGTYVNRPAKTSFTLEAVVNKHSAMIDGKWYKKDDKVHGYVVQAIGYNSVQLSSKKKKLHLTLSKKNDKIKINAK